MQLIAIQLSTTQDIIPKHRLVFVRVVPTQVIAESIGHSFREGTLLWPNDQDLSTPTLGMSLLSSLSPRTTLLHITIPSLDGLLGAGTDTMLPNPGLLTKTKLLKQHHLMGLRFLCLETLSGAIALLLPLKLT